jgi:arylsulfatase A-like enzyme
MDLSKESAATCEAYGLGKQPTDSFARQCLLARRFAESGVRFIQLNATGGKGNNWDHHDNVYGRMIECCGQTDQPLAALIADLKQRGLWEDTLLVCSGEFGRTPDGKNGGTKKAGRDHNNQGFTVVVGGGGVKSGLTYGATDELGMRAVEDRVHVHDLHATMLHLLGLDHERLTYRYGGRDFRLTDVYGRVVKEILA